MTDKEVFFQFMNWMNMSIYYDCPVDNNHLYFFKDTSVDHPRFTTFGYDEFTAGGIFTEEGSLVLGYMDSHVAYSSKNAKKFKKYLPDHMKRHINQ